jgi:hypothetical protein
VGPFHYLLTNFDLVMSFGAEAAFDYRESHCATKVPGVANFRFSRARHHFFQRIRANVCRRAERRFGRSVYVDLTNRFSSRKVIPKSLLLWSALREAVHFMGHYMPAVPEDLSFHKDFTDTAEVLLQDGNIRPHPIRIMQGGLEGIVAGLQELYDGRVSGEKLVYTITTA